MNTFAQTMYARVPAAKAALAFIDQRIVLLNVVGLCLAVLLCVGYIVQVNASVASGYTARDLERRAAQLTHDNQRLQLAVSRLQTLDHIRATSAMLGLVPAGQPLYLSLGEPSVALAK